MLYTVLLYIYWNEKRSRRRSFSDRFRYESSECKVIWNEMFYVAIRNVGKKDVF